MESKTMDCDFFEYHISKADNSKLNIQQSKLPTAPHCHTDTFEVVVCIYGSAIECFYEKQVK